MERRDGGQFRLISDSFIESITFETISKGEIYQAVIITGRLKFPRSEY